MTDIIFEYKELLAQKLEIEQKLSILPKGYISKKKIGGKQYLYLHPISLSSTPKHGQTPPLGPLAAGVLPSSYWK